ncbi:hypothetical protein GA0070613_1737 [Micromonospora inositola]|uniref:Uncharacterized protein n=1 Tax=Micromonospora inositola TaxID=47865 RepID=A0A1C5HS87_9ACTN|nr:hypothetical protein GA0070613_1737 [Micromonospora inositola]
MSPRRCASLVALLVLFAAAAWTIVDGGDHWVRVVLERRPPPADR